MKFYKLLFLTLLSCFALSCSEDKIDDPSNDSESRLAESQFDNSYLGVYKGLFSTNDGLTRGSVVITLSPTLQATARITLSSGEIIELKSSKVKLTVDNNIDNLRFSSTGLSNIDALLNFSVEGNGANPVISNVTFDNKQSDILIAKNLSRAPLNTITGTYARTAGTGGFSTSNRTWNVMAIGSGNQTYATQIFYGNRIYTTMPSGTQSNCSNSGDFATCDIDGSARILGYDVTWTGTHTYDRYTDNTACSEVSGTWSAPAYGGSSGTFVSDTDCNDVQLSNDFCEDADVIAIGETVSGFTEGFGFIATAGDTPVGNCEDTLAGSADGIGVWYTFTSAEDMEITVSTDNDGTDFDTQLRIFSGTCGSLLCVANNDDVDAANFNYNAEVEFSAIADVTYYIFLGGYNTASGLYNLSVMETPPPPPPLTCGDTLVDTGGPSSEYSVDELIFYTIDAGPGQVVQLNFSTFDMESGYDEMYFIDGNDIENDFLILLSDNNVSPTVGAANNSFTGTDLQGDSITSTGQYMTVVFLSDDFCCTGPGYEASVLCLTARLSSTRQGIVNRNNLENPISFGTHKRGEQRIKKMK